MRTRPIAALSVAALAAVVLAGCSAGTTEAEPTPSGTAGDLCAAAVAPGAVSDAVTVEGDTGEESTATFDFPAEVDVLQSTVITEGDGDPVETGDFVSYALTAFSADDGEVLGSVGYGDDPVLPQQISPDNPLGQLLGCATPGTRVVAAFPPSESSGGEVYIVDLLDVVPTAAWGEPQEPVEGMPTVELADDGEPEITLPGGDAPAEVELGTLKLGDGATVATGDTVLVQYKGVKWSDGSVFDSSWERGVPASFQTTGVVAGFQQALEGQTVGSQVVVVIPPEFGYGASEGHELQDETLVFVVDIIGVQHAATAQ
ncbi:FKBP-type peptidyl-prolyl cis-trans isomerase [Microbacterium hominis]|uniref:Peptidyl-prolyl cis-trans isomerase n=1 Tax=Microbacterium hominis TaxID=162426 RepID=A0A7D4TG53_9MICO|nr:FKBP-type peptidyl-prolyl cis-trans isomerase [Microbacterium hominis]QKJ19880.1 FKBP-type peptidyl-prolyl cis-trans isomerase [Microbacterium hominis]